jgi:hypothetical protein
MIFTIEYTHKGDKAMQQYVVLGKNGKIDRFLANPEVLAKKDKPPLAEMQLNDLSSWPHIVGFVSDINKVFDNIESEYLSRGKFGPYGDVIFVFHQDDTYFMSLIVQFAFPKPGLAADLIPFVRDKRGQLFFIGIVRKNNPGKGNPASIGGFRNVKGFHFASAAETIISEGEEESGLKVVVCNDVIMNDVKNIINLREFRAKIIIGDIEKYTRVQLVGTYHTSEDEEISTTGYKRVYETTAYAFVINVDEDLSEETLAAKLKAGDDAQDIFVWNLTRRGGSPKLAFAHHDEILSDAWKIIR